MDHVVYLDAKANELGKLLEGSKSMIMRGAAGRKMPYGRVNEGDILYFINNKSEGVIRAKVTSVLNSDKLDFDASTELVMKNQEKLLFTDKQIKRWAGKRYLVLIVIDEISDLDPFPIDKSDFGNMDDWLPVENIETVKI